jgi:hypothetical protein
VLDRAAQRMPMELGTLDAIHLASALLCKEAMEIDPVMATHDGALGLAAQAHGFKVSGTSLASGIDLQNGPDSWKAVNAQDFAQSTDLGSDSPRSMPQASTATQALPAIDTGRCRTNMEGGHSGESIDLDTC